MPSFKSDSKCEELLQKGIHFHKQTKFIDALICYNEALCYAEKIDSMKAARLFATRSIVYMNLELPEACLKNIELARDAGYPAEKMESLYCFKKKCHEMIAQKDPAAKDPVKDFFKLSYPAHEKTPFLANCVELRENEKNGRGLYATQDLKPGDVIAVVEPVVKALFKNGHYRRCTNCLGVKNMNLMPCSGCVYAMFCSKKCQREANEKFHQFECPPIAAFCNNFMGLYSEIYPALSRTFFEALHVAGGLDKLKAICADKEIQQKTFFDYDLSEDNNPSLELNQLLAALGHIPISKGTVLEAVINKWAVEQPLSSAWKTPDEKEDVRKILWRLYDINKMPFDYIYGKILYGNLVKKTTCEDLKFGKGLNLVLSYINHSCSPNVEMITLENRFAFIVCRPIWKNQQIFHSIGLIFEHISEENRQFLYRSKYGFNCDCEACVNNYPMAAKLKLADNANFINIKQPQDPLGDVYEMLSEYRKNCSLIAKFFNQRPCMEVSCVVERNNAILLKLASLASSFGKFTK